ncbi:MAG: alpha/beta hydrolase, partial [bacterium]|nr:alpha/beta hydrolase [bacterium]
MTKTIAAIALAIALVVSAIYVHARAGFEELDDAARARAPGAVAELPEGRVHYAWHGPENGPITVLVHGFSTPSFVWKGLLGPLTDAGMRVL